VAAKPKASILDEIRESCPPMRGGWKKSLDHEVMKQLEEVKRAHLAGELPTVSCKGLSEWLIKKFNLPCTVQTIRNWMGR